MGTDEQLSACSGHAVPYGQGRQFVLPEFGAVFGIEGGEEASLASLPCTVRILRIDDIRRSGEKDGICGAEHGSDADCEALVPEGFYAGLAAFADSLFVLGVSGGGF